MKNPSSIRWLQRARAAFFALMLAVPVASSAAVYVSVAIAPPPLPVYAQPICPGPGYIWIPGYWAYGPAGYYWVAGVWVLPPYVGALWTPGYWGWGSGAYLWHAGYWGTSVGFYGGINYGFGYTGYGYHGGYWRGNAFYYDVAANNVNTSVVHTTYRTTVNNVATSRVSYNGGRGGITARPTAGQLAYARQPHTAATTTQVRREQTAANHRSAAATNREPAAIAKMRQPQQPAPGHQAATQAQATPFHNAPTHVARMQAAPEHSQPTHVTRTQAAPERNLPARVEHPHTAPVRSEPTRTAGAQTAPPHRMPAPAHASPPQASASASVVPMRSRGEPPHAEVRHPAAG